MNLNSIKDFKSIIDLFLKVPLIINQMRSYCKNLKDQTVIKKALYDLSPKCNMIFIITEESKDTNTLSIDKLMGSILIYE